MFDGLPRRLEEQTVLRVDRGRFAIAETEELCVESGQDGEKSAPPLPTPGRHYRIEPSGRACDPALQTRQADVDGGRRRAFVVAYCGYFRSLRAKWPVWNAARSWTLDI